MCSWLEATSVSHKESAINIHPEVVQKCTASTTVAEALSGPPLGFFRKRAARSGCRPDPAIHTMKGRSGRLVPEARADLAVVVQAMSEHSLHTSLTGKASDHGDLDGRTQVEPPHVSFGSKASF